MNKLLLLIIIFFFPLCAICSNEPLTANVDLVHSDGTKTTVVMHFFTNDATTCSVGDYDNFIAIDTLQEGEVTIPDNVDGYTVTTVGMNAFAQSHLAKINLPSTLQVIEECAFENCKNVESIELPESLTTIKDNAFSKSGLKSITIPANVTEFGDEIFKGCSSLTEITVYCDPVNLPLDLTEGTGVTNVTYGSNITEIPAYTYKGSALSGTYEVPANITEIGTGAFEDCKNLTGVVIHANVNYIGNEAFKGCTNLKNVTIAEGSKVKNLYSSIFENCTSLETIEIPENVTKIWDYVFKGCTSLKTINNKAHLTSIGKGAFQGTKITSFDIPDGLTEIAQDAFNGVTTLTSISLPSTVKTVDNRAFYGCTGITSINIENVTSIGEEAFCGTSLTSVKLPANLTDLEKRAFADCKGLADVTITNGITYLPENLFDGCTSLTKIVLPASITSVGQYAFARCSNLEYIDATEATGFAPNNVLRNWNTNPGSSVSWPLGSVPNSTLVYLPKGFSLSQELIAPNTILSTDEGKTCSDYQLATGKPLDIPYAFTADKVTVTGLKSGAKTTLVLPFAIDNLNGVGKFYEYVGNDAAGVKFQGVNKAEGFKAYVVEPSATSISLSKSIEVGATSDYSTTDKSGLVGVLTSTTAPDNAYVLSGDNFVKANATTVSPLQAYLVPSTATTSESLPITTAKAPTNPEGTTITISTGGMSTFTSDIDVDFSSWESAGVKAYVATGYDPATDDFIMQRVSSIAAGQGVLLKGDPNTQVQVVASSSPIYTLNLMKGVTDDLTIGGTAGGYTNFRLTNGDSGITFYSFTRNVTLSAGQAYLQIPTDVATKATSNGAKGLKLEFVDGETTGISVINGEVQRKQSDAIYDLQGRRVSKPQKGIYIVNDKKVVIK